MNFEKLKPYLIDLKYPNITGMTSDQFKEIFKAENIYYFFQWFLKELFSDEFVKNFTSKELANILHNFGYCKIAQKDDFATGQLKSNIQAKLLHRMLFHLKLFKSKKNDINPVDSTSLDEIDELVSMEINLFPRFIGKKQYEDKERIEIIHDLKGNFAALQEEIQNLELQIEQKHVEDVIISDAEISSVNITDAINNFSLKKGKIVEIQDNFIKKFDKEETVPVSETLFSKIEECSQLSNDLKQYYGNLKALEDFNALNSVKLKKPKELREIVNTCVRLTDQW